MGREEGRRGREEGKEKGKEEGGMVLVSLPAMMKSAALLMSSPVVNLSESTNHSLATHFLGMYTPLSPHSASISN